MAEERTVARMGCDKQRMDSFGLNGVVAQSVSKHYQVDLVVVRREFEVEAAVLVAAVAAAAEWPFGGRLGRLVATHPSDEGCGYCSLLYFLVVVAAGAEDRHHTDCCVEVETCPSIL